MNAMLREEPIETLLRAWGRVCGERPPAEWDEGGGEGGGASIHPIAQAMDFAPGKRVKRLDVAFRRMILPGERAWTRDPIRCTETRSRRIAQKRYLPPEIARVERAALDLLAFDRLRGLVLRVNYCTRGAHEDKVGVVAERYGAPVKLRRYRDELALARAWMEGRLGA